MGYEQKPQQIDRYIIRQVLGTGAMGTVYAAWDPKLRREVALKVVSAKLSTEAKGRERFVREARAIAAVRHPNIIEIYDYSGIDAEYLYLVIEKLEGQDLYQMLSSLGMTPEPIAAALGHELCLALQAAHDVGIVHRDLKPENVFINGAGRVVLTDFGIVKAVRAKSAIDGYEENTDIIGTPGFMAPEVMKGRAFGSAIDIFALGALLYNITTKRLPFEGDSPMKIFEAVNQGQYNDPRMFNPLLSAEFCAVIAHCLQPNPKKRPRNAEAVRQALKEVLVANDVTDVRDDLRHYMDNAKQYKQMAQQRYVEQILSAIKIAAKDHDQEQINRHRRRLEVLSPHNLLLEEISGVLNPLSTLRQQKFTVHNKTPGRRMASMMLSFLCMVGMMLVSQNTDSTWWLPNSRQLETPIAKILTPPVPREATPLPVDPASHKVQVDMQVVDGKADVIVNGQDLGKLHRQTLFLSPGSNMFVFSRGRHQIQRKINLLQGSHVTLRANTQHQSLELDD